MTAPLRVGVAGLGTIGGGTVRLLSENADLIAARCGRPVTVVAVAERDRERAAAVDVGSAELLGDGLEILLGHAAHLRGILENVDLRPAV